MASISGMVFKSGLLATRRLLTPISKGLVLPPALMVAASNHAKESVTVAGPGRTAYQVFDEEVTSAAIDFLRRRKDRLPFCAVVGFVLPHSPYICHQRDWDYYQDRVTVPDPPPGTLENLHPAVKAWREGRGIAHLSRSEVRRGRAGYYGLISQVDRQVGRILEALRQSGNMENTVVIYTSDHGDMAGENGMWWKSNFYEASVRVPLIVAWPGVVRPATRLRNILGLVNLAPTLTAIGGGPALPGCQASSLLALLRDGRSTWNNEVYSELPPLNEEPAMRMIRSEQWKLTYYEGYRPQLFDLENDPHEYTDLGESEEHKAVREILHKKALTNWSAERIRKTLEVRERDRNVIRLWGQKIEPSSPPQWRASAGSNAYAPPPKQTPQH